MKCKATDIDQTLAKAHAAGADWSDRQCMELARTCADFNMRRAARLVSQVFNQELKPAGIRITQFSLMVSAKMSENLVLHKLARVLGMDRTTLSRNLRLLEKNGLAELTKGDDRREVLVRLTPLGEETLQRALPLWAKAQQKVIDSVGSDKWEGILADLRQLTSGLK